MAYGDDKRVRNRIEEQRGLAQNNLTNLRTRTVDQQYPMFFDNYRNAVNQQAGERSNIFKGYGEFAKTGGFSPLDTANIRARSMAPNRGIFDAARRGINRFGGPARTAALSRLSRDTGQQMSDTATAAEANIAQMRQQGRLAGIGGMANMYSATPGLVNMYGNQLQQNTQQQLGIEGLQNQFSLGLINAQQQAAQLPGKWEGIMGRINDVVDLGSKVASAGMNVPWGGGKGMGSVYTPPNILQQHYPRPPAGY